jgi:hypothetical protein
MSKSTGKQCVKVGVVRSGNNWLCALHDPAKAEQRAKSARVGALKRYQKALGVKPKKTARRKPNGRAEVIADSAMELHGVVLRMIRNQFRAIFEVE